MSTINIRPAKRTGSKVVVGIAGVSGSGKTHTALLIARGMVKKASEIGFLDAENGRGSLFSDALDDEFMIGDLYPPFSPVRYAASIKEFQDSGVKVLIIDSGSHEWEGDGGCEDIANNTTGKIANWKGAKAEHKKFIRALLQSDMHIIICFRAREKTDFSNPSKPKSLGLQPICEKNVMFEMTVSFMIHNCGKQQQLLKPLPGGLASAFGDGNNYLGEECGRQIVAWVEGGDQTDADLESWKNKMQMACDGGVESLKEEWLKMPKAIIKRMKPFYESFEKSAKAFDDMNKPEEAAPDLGGAASQNFNPAETVKPQAETQPAKEEPESPDGDDPFK